MCVKTVEADLDLKLLPAPKPVCASKSHVCLVKPVAKSVGESLGIQQETITFRAFPAARITPLIGHLQSEVEAESFRSGVQEAVSCPGTITPDS